MATIDKEKMRAEIKQAKNEGAELIVVAMHWGIEYVLLENNVQRNLSEFLIDCGVDIIIGGHPHVVQPMKVIRNDSENKEVLIVYSLGNFISNMKTADTRGGAMVWVTITRDDNGLARFDSAKYNLVYSAKPENDHNYIIYPSWKEEEIPAAQKQHWELFKRGALKIFNKHNINVPQNDEIQY